MLDRCAAQLVTSSLGMKSFRKILLEVYVTSLNVNLSCNRSPPPSCSGYNKCLQNEVEEEVFRVADGCTPDEEGVL